MSPSSGGSLLDQAAALRAARRRAKQPAALRRVVARARLDSDVGERPRTALEKREARRVREAAEMARLFSRTESAPKITSFAGLLTASTHVTEGLAGRRWSTTFEAKFGTTRVVATKTAAALGVGDAAPPGDEAAWIAAVVGPETTGFLESRTQRRALHAALSRPEALGARPPTGGVDGFEAVPTSGFRAAGVTAQRVAVLDATGAVASVMTSVQETPRKPGVFGLWRPLSRSNSSRFGYFLDR